MNIKETNIDFTKGVISTLIIVIAWIFVGKIEHEQLQQFAAMLLIFFTFGIVAVMFEEIKEHVYWKDLKKRYENKKISEN